ncbi:hypothetical protein [Klebsiella phage vB_KshKPC-M]|nr:hypothetical protein [Klebsiella phage vB_KshKPC-M]
MTIFSNNQTSHLRRDADPILINQSRPGKRARRILPLVRQVEIHRNSRVLHHLRSRGHGRPFRREPGSRVQKARIA